VRGEERRQPRRIAARHTAFRGHAVDPGMTPRRGEPRRIALHVVVMDEAEIKRSVGTQAQMFERREMAISIMMPMS